MKYALSIHILNQVNFFNLNELRILFHSFVSANLSNLTTNNEKNLTLKTSLTNNIDSSDTFYIQAIRDLTEKRFESFFLRLNNGRPFLAKPSRGFMMNNNEVHIWNFETNQAFLFYYTKLSDSAYIRVRAIPMELYFICDSRTMIHNWMIIAILIACLIFICLIMVCFCRKKKIILKDWRNWKESIKEMGLKFDMDKSIKNYRYSKSRKKSTNWEKEGIKYVHVDESAKLIQVKSDSSEIQIKSSSTIDTLISKLAVTSSEEKLENESDVNLNKFDSAESILTTNSSIKDNESLISNSSKTDKKIVKETPEKTNKKSKTSKKPEKDSSSNKKEKSKTVKAEKVQLSNKKDQSKSGKSKKAAKMDQMNEIGKSTPKKAKTSKTEDKSKTLKPKKLVDEKSKKDDRKNVKVEKNKTEKSKNSSSKKSKTKPGDKDQSKKQAKSKNEKTSKTKKETKKKLGF